MATPTSELNAALRNAHEPDEIIAAVARLEYRRAHPGLDCPDELVPDDWALRRFLLVPESHEHEIWRPFESDRLTALYRPRFGASSRWGWSIGVREFPYRDGYRGGLAAYCVEIADEDCPWVAVVVERPADPERARAWDAAGLPARQPYRERQRPPQHFVEAVHGDWLALREDARGTHPLGAFVAAWQDAHKPAVVAETRADKRILPHITGGDEHPAVIVGNLFRGIHEGRRIQQPELPLWPGVPDRKRVPILDVVDAAGVPVVQRGGAPVELRLFVRTLSAVPPWARALRASFPLPLRARDLLDALWPVSPTTGRRTWRVGEHWPKLRHALLHARDYAIHDGRGRWFPLGLRYLPDALMRDDPEPAFLDERVVLDVAFPEGATSGPPVALPVMDRLMVQSASRWRAFIAAHCIAWIPGATRVPVMVGKRKTRRHTWARDVSAYPVLTLEDMRRLAFGNDPRHSPTAKVRAAFRGLPGLVVLDEAAQDERHGEAGFRIVPDDAAKAIARMS